MKVASLIKNHGLLEDLSKNQHPQYEGVLAPIPLTGRWHSGSIFSGGGSNHLMTANQLEALPFPVFTTTRYDRIGVRVITGSIGTNIRLGLYTANQNTRMPETLYRDYGTVSTAASGFDSTITIKELLDPGLYWAVGVADFGITVQGTALADSVAWLGATNLSGLFQPTSALLVSGLGTGAFPDDFPAYTGTSRGRHFIGMRVQ